MKNKAGIICISSITVLGDLLLSLKFSGNLLSDAFGFLLAFLAAVLLLFVIKYIVSIWDKLNFKGKKILHLTFLFLSVLILITTALFTAHNFSCYAAQIMLSVNDVFLPFVSVFAIALFLAFGGKKVLLKISVLTFPLVFVVIVFMFAFSVQFMNIKYLLPHKPINISLLSSFVPLLLNLSASAVPIVFLGKEQKGKSLVASYLLSFFVFTLSVVNVLALFGSELAATLNYPYSVSVSTASMGEIFSRLDGFFYAVAFFTALIRIAVCIYSAKEIALSFFCKIKANFFNFTIEKRKEMW